MRFMVCVKGWRGVSEEGHSHVLAGKHHRPELGGLSFPLCSDEPRKTFQAKAQELAFFSVLTVIYALRPTFFIRHEATNEVPSSPRKARDAR